jgi:hypothetical protein
MTGACRMRLSRLIFDQALARKIQLTPAHDRMALPRPLARLGQIACTEYGDKGHYLRYSALVSDVRSPVYRATARMQGW